MFWSGIVGDKLIGPFKVPEGVKLTSEIYIEFLKTHFGNSHMLLLFHTSGQEIARVPL